VTVFLDASALIYWLEGSSSLRASVSRLIFAPRSGVAMSRLSWLECRVKPLRVADTGLLAKYDAFFARPDLIWIDLSAEVVELAAAIRAECGLKTPDALQAACCLQLGADHRFVTGDKAFERVAGLNVEVVAA
jgi:predicted nucleic acid-binding protein